MKIGTGMLLTCMNKTGIQKKYHFQYLFLKLKIWIIKVSPRRQNLFLVHFCLNGLETYRKCQFLHSSE